MLAGKILLIAAVFAARAAVAQPDTLSLELNATEQLEGACRLIFMVRNDAAEAVDSQVYETVLIGTDGQVRLLTLFDFGEAPAGKLRVRQFDVPQTQCGDIGRLLFNGVSTRPVNGGESTCLL